MTHPAVLIPAWPYMLDEGQACAYVSERRDALPPPAYGRGRTARWRRVDLEQWADQRAGRAAPVNDDANEFDRRAHG
ncbi:MAG: hypothetical protein HWD60_09500 [Defluviicoccus sp.]|nr:MAG: hypothetical protein HWD60_09500 [Defluviicoccus sp.]